MLNRIYLTAMSAIVCIALATSGNRACSGAEPAAPVKQSPGEELAAKRKALAERMAKLTVVEPAESPAGESAERTEVASEAAEELDLLQSLDLVYVQHEATIEHRFELEKEKKRVQDELDSLHNFGPAEPKPYSFLLSEDVRDQLAAEDDREEAVEADLSAAQQMLQAARETFEECESERRQAREALEENEEADEKAKLTADLRRAELNSTIASETVNLRRVEIEVKTARRELGEIRRTFLKEKAERIAKDVRFTERDYQSRLNELTKYREEFRRKLKVAEKLLHQHEALQLKTLATLAGDGTDKAIIAAATEAFQVARRAHHEEITQINQRLRELDHQKHYVNCRYEMATGTSSKEELVELFDRVEETTSQLKETERSLALRLEEIRVDQATLYRRAHVVASDNQGLSKWIAFQSQQLERLVELSETSLMHLRSLRRSQQRFLEDLEAVTQTAKGPDWFATTIESFTSFWNYQFASVDDRPITIGKIVSAIFYLAVGVLLAKLISRIVARNVLPRLGLNEGAISAIRSVLFYSLCVLFALLSLELVNLPFAAFTFLGGAVAIAFGFGSQNILNNFISGLILLAEQPIRVGDLIELEGIRGTVEHIGARSTRVKTMSNHEIIVPNSILLENKVTNLTLTDNLVQTAIGVSLSPRLSVDEVRRRLYEAAIGHAKVLKTPQPIVLFLEFSNTTLSFELHFWLQMSSVMECRLVESEVRETISNALRDTNAATTTVAPVALVAPAGLNPATPIPANLSPTQAGAAMLAAAATAAKPQPPATDEPPTLKLGADKLPLRQPRRDAG